MSVDIFSLNGPRRFIEHAAGDFLGGQVITALRAPETWEERLVAGFCDAFHSRHGYSPSVVDCSSLGSGSPEHYLAAYAQIDQLNFQSLAEFVQEVGGAPQNFFLLRNIQRRDWRTWSFFLRRYQEIVRREWEGDAHCTIMVMLDPNLPAKDFEEVFDRKAVKVWEAVLSKSDMEFYIEARIGKPVTLAERIARETSIEVAGTNFSVLDTLSQMSTDFQFDPLEHLSKLAWDSPEDVVFSWSAGTMDYWGDEVRPDTEALIQAGRGRELSPYVWRAHNRVAMEISDTIRRVLIRKYRPRLERLVNATTPFMPNQYTKKTSPDDLECADILKLSVNEVDKDGNIVRQGDHFLFGSDFDLAKYGKKMRNNVAHFKTIDKSDFYQFSDLMEKDEFTDTLNHPGWNWPNSGQCVRMVIGPPAAGKTTYSKANFPGEGYISSDEVRDETLRNGSGGRNEALIQNTMIARARSHLRRGVSVTLDATFLNQYVRKQFITSFPHTMPIEYHVIDRPIAEKLRDAGEQRMSRTKNGVNIVEGYAQEMERQIDELLGGDGYENVIVFDLRKG